MTLLVTLAEHNAWANGRIFAASAAISEAALADDLGDARLEKLTRDP